MKNNFTRPSPANINGLLPANYQFSIHNIPNTVYFCQSVNLPGLTLGEVGLPNQFVTAPIPGDNIEFDDFIIQFLIQENLVNWNEIFNWMIGLGFPDNFDQRKNWMHQQTGNNDNRFSDGTLLILSNEKNKLLEISFEDMFPMNLSSINLSSIESDAEYLTATATFQYTQYKFI